MRHNTLDLTLALTITIVLSSHIFTVPTVCSDSEKCEICDMTNESNDLTFNYENATIETYYFDEEEYINDIPFCTNRISAEANYLNAFAENYDFEQESYIDDIPFNTKYLVQNLSNTTEQQINYASKFVI